MRFPGHRIAKHYFPVTQKAARLGPEKGEDEKRWYVVGLDHVLVDMEIQGPPGLAEELDLTLGESTLLSESEVKKILKKLSQKNISCRYAAGGTVANTLNNYTFLSGEPAVLLGSIEDCIRVGQPAFYYVAQTPKAVDLSLLHPVAGSIGTAITFISSDGERSFAISAGVSNEVQPESIPKEVVDGANVALTTLYCLRDPNWPIAKSALRLMSLAKAASVPVAFGLGTASLVREKRKEVKEILEQYVTVAAMNIQESEALTGEPDALLASRTILDWVDLVIVTEGPRGMTIGGYTDEAYKRETDQEIRSKSITQYNRWEYSRLMRKTDCDRPLKVYSHIHPYRGGPDRLKNTSGAGDAALAAVLHDMAANRYHRATVPDSEKHAAKVSFLTYSSLSRIAQYGNRVAYEVLKGHSPRLDGPVGPDEGDASE